MRSGNLAAAAAASVALLLSALASAAGPAGVIVYPTGIWPDDVRNVQAAIDKGGTVLLEPVNTAGDPTDFNFGPAERLPLTWVFLRTDVNLIGERRGSRRATIRGGWGPFFGVSPVKTRIQGFDFVGPLADAIEILVSTGVEIVDNRISAVVPDPLSVGFTFGDGIDVFGGDVAGKVRIAANVIENLTADFSIGIQLDGVAGDVELSDNIVSIAQTPGTGRIESEALVVLRSEGTVKVTHNTLILGPGRAFAGLFLAGSATADYSASANTVIGDPDAVPLPDDLRTGIWIEGGRVTDGMTAPDVRANLVMMHGADCSICVIGRVTGGAISGNQIVGDGETGLLVSNIFPGDMAVSNQFLGDDMSQFSPRVVHGYLPPAQVFLDAETRDNTVVGKCSTAIDLGVDNKVSCVGSNANGNSAPHGNVLRQSFGSMAHVPMRSFPDLNWKLQALPR